MQFDAELLLIAVAPVFLACIGWEAWHLRHVRPARPARPGEPIYGSRDSLCDARLADATSRRQARTARVNSRLCVLLPASPHRKMAGGLDIVRRAVHRAGPLPPSRSLVAVRASVMRTVAEKTRDHAIEHQCKPYGRDANAARAEKASVSCRHAADAAGAACNTWHKGHIDEEM